MSDRNFKRMLGQQWARGNFVCVGLDSDFPKIPESAHEGDGEIDTNIGLSIIAFNEAIVNATRDLVCAYKLNVAFYEKYGHEGVIALEETIRYIRSIAPEVLIILDAKRADIGNTNEGYVRAAFIEMDADAITVHPYLGAEALTPFLEQADKGIIVLCRTSNKGAGEFQDLQVNGEPLYQIVARHVADEWNKNDNCALVVGATYPDELRKVREIAGDIPILLPGIGAQGGDVEKTVLAGRDSRNQGMIINSSRGIIFASKGDDFDKAARRETKKLRTLINKHRIS